MACSGCARRRAKLLAALKRKPKPKPAKGGSGKKPHEQT